MNLEMYRPDLPPGFRGAEAKMGMVWLQEKKHVAGLGIPSLRWHYLWGERHGIEDMKLRQIGCTFVNSEAGAVEPVFATHHERRGLKQTTFLVPPRFGIRNL